MELRDFGPTGRRLGTEDDCYDGSPWELHRGELWEQMGSKDIHGILMALLAALFRTHARPGVTVMADVYCDLTDDTGASLRAPDVALVGDLVKPKNEVYRGTPILAVEVRGTQSKRYLEEKVKLYLEHDWPNTWIVHAERQEVEVLRPGTGSVVYRPGTSVPLVAELDHHGLTTLPVNALFDPTEARRCNDGWVAAQAATQAATQATAQAVLRVLASRGFALPKRARQKILQAPNPIALIGPAATAPTVEAFLKSLT
jgi:Uma2 family endonuclease